MTMAASFFADPSFAVSLAFLGFCALAGKKLFQAVKAMAVAHQATVEKPFTDIHDLLHEAKNALEEAQKKHGQQGLQEENLLMLATMEVEAVEAGLEVMLAEEENIAQAFYRQHTASILHHWQQARTSELMTDIYHGVASYAREVSPEASAEFGLGLVQKAFDQAGPEALRTKPSSLSPSQP